MKPNFRLCDACKKRIPEGMEFQTGYKGDNIPDYFDMEKGTLVPTNLIVGKTNWELCHNCMLSLIKGIIDSSDAKQESKIHVRLINIRANGG